MAITPDERWAVFRSLSTRTMRPMNDIAHEAGLRIGRLYRTLAELERDGLAECRESDVLLWKAASC